MRKELAVKKTVTVNAPQKHVFTVFTEGHGAWWPLQTHHIGAQTPQTAIIEPRAGGRWFERAADGTECDWGKVLLWSGERGSEDGQTNTALGISDADREQLRAMVRSHSMPHSLVRRAQIVLLSGECSQSAPRILHLSSNHYRSLLS